MTARRTIVVRVRSPHVPAGGAEGAESSTKPDAASAEERETPRRTAPAPEAGADAGAEPVVVSTSDAREPTVSSVARPARRVDPKRDVRRLEANLARLSEIVRAQGIDARPEWAYRELGDPAEVAARLRRVSPSDVFDPFRTFHVTVPEAEAERVLDALRALSFVENAYLAPRVLPACPAPLLADADVPWRDLTGVNALADSAGASGKGFTLLAIEEGFALPHVDLPPVAAMGGIGDLGASVEHGTMSLGLVAASPNGAGVAGAAPDVTILRGGLGNTAGFATLFYSRLLNVVLALGSMSPAPSPRRTVVLLAQQVGDWYGLPDGGAATLYSGLPLDVDPELRGLLDLLASPGRIVVIAAGNGAGPDLDKVAFSENNDPAGPFAKLPSSKLLRVGGARVTGVAAPVAQYVHARSRVHVYAPSDGVTTTGAANGYVTYGGSSAATALVAGLVVALQGLREARHPTRPLFTATKLKRLFSRGKGLGTLVYRGPASSSTLGVVPDLARIVLDPDFAA